MFRSLTRAALPMLMLACGGAPEPLPASWQLTPQDVAVLVDDALTRQPHDVVALDAAYRWAAMQMQVTEATELGWRLYAVSAYPDGNARLFSELVALGAVPPAQLALVCQSYSARGLLLDAAASAHPELLHWIDLPVCAAVEGRDALVLRWVEMVRLDAARMAERDAGLVWLEQHLAPAARTRIRLGWLLRDAGYSERCRQSLATLHQLMPHDHEVDKAVERCGS